MSADYCMPQHLRILDRHTCECFIVTFMSTDPQGLSNRCKSSQEDCLRRAQDPDPNPQPKPYVCPREKMGMLEDGSVAGGWQVMRPSGFRV